MPLQLHASCTWPGNRMSDPDITPEYVAEVFHRALYDDLFIHFLMSCVVTSSFSSAPEGFWIEMGCVGA